MSKPLRKIDVDGLRVGMYVSRLDRPWLETPFLFQGFFIRNENEIEDLRRYCDFVDIDLEESDARIVQFLDPPGSSNQQRSKASERRGFWRSRWQRILSLFGVNAAEAPRELKPGEFYQDTASIADELVVAKSIHSGALEKLMNVLEGIRNGSAISMPELEVVTLSLIHISEPTRLQ